MVVCHRADHCWGYSHEAEVVVIRAGVLYAPILAVLIPGDIAFKAIVGSGLAVVHAAYSFGRAEYILAAAVQSVALKRRAAAACDAYSWRGYGTGSILPFTSVVSGLCAALTVSVIEFIPEIASPIGKSLATAFFPTLSALFVGASAVTKESCVRDADSTAVAAETIKESGQPKGFRFLPFEAFKDILSLILKYTYVLWLRLLRWINILPKKA